MDSDTFVPGINAIKLYKHIQVNKTPSLFSSVFSHKDPFNSSKISVTSIELLQWWEIQTFWKQSGTAGQNTDQCTVSVPGLHRLPQLSCYLGPKSSWAALWVCYYWGYPETSPIRNPPNYGVRPQIAVPEVTPLMTLNMSFVPGFGQNSMFCLPRRSSWQAWKKKWHEQFSHSKKTWVLLLLNVCNFLVKSNWM